MTVNVVFGSFEAKRWPIEENVLLHVLGFIVHHEDKINNLSSTS
jgi:hypothetical protein